MTDVLDAIDAAIAQTCACGCQQPLSPDGPSGWFADQDCQQRWHAARTHLPHEVLGRTDGALTAEAVTAAWEGIRQALTPVVQTMVTAIRQFNAFCERHQIQATPPADPRERALQARRNRNTGPAPRQRAPKRLDPRRTR